MTAWEVLECERPGEFQPYAHTWSVNINDVTHFALEGLYQFKMTSKWRWPQNKDKDDLKMKITSKWRRPQNEAV